MTRQDGPASKPGAGFERLLTSKARMQGNGPPFVKFGRSIRYAEGTLVQWTKAHLRQSTNEK
jgi:hypothetical protein